MRSRVAEEVRRQRAIEMLALPPSRRLEIALELGRLDLEQLAVNHGISREEASRRVRMVRQVGRRRSTSAQG